MARSKNLRISLLASGLFIALALTVPNISSACEAWCTFGSCFGSSNCGCCGGNAYCDTIIVSCYEDLSINSTPEELKAFKAKIDRWSENRDLASLVEPATAVYDSLLFHDSEAFSQAKEKLEKALAALPERSHMALLQTEQSRVDKQQN